MFCKVAMANMWFAFCYSSVVIGKTDTKINNPLYDFYHTPIICLVHANHTRPIAALTLHLFMAKTPDCMVINHADGLHERIDNRRPAKVEAAFFQVFGNLC